MFKCRVLVIFLICTVVVTAQPTLPNFAISSTKQNNTKLSWRNPHKNCVQLLIQRSVDNQKTFTTIRSATHPDMSENDFIDKKTPTHTTPYYRISYTLRGGKTFFTVAQSIHKKQSGLAHIVEEPKKTIIPPQPVKQQHISVHPKGYVLIQLPEIATHRYSITIYDTDGTVLFNLTSITQSPLILEKGNFHRSGWFDYSLFEDDQLIEKNKFYLAKDE